MRSVVVRAAIMSLVPMLLAGCDGSPGAGLSGGFDESVCYEVSSWPWQALEAGYTHGLNGAEAGIYDNNSDVIYSEGIAPPYVRECYVIGYEWGWSAMEASIA